MPALLAQGRQVTGIQGSGGERAMIPLGGASEEPTVDLRFGFEVLAPRLVDGSDGGGFVRHGGM